MEKIVKWQLSTINDNKAEGFFKQEEDIFSKTNTQKLIMIALEWRFIAKSLFRIAPSFQTFRNYHSLIISTIISCINCSTSARQPFQTPDFKELWYFKENIKILPVTSEKWYCNYWTGSMDSTAEVNRKLNY